LHINGDTKDYEEISKLCLFVATLDKKANGTIECNGEEYGDNWLVEINDGVVFIKQSEIVYDKYGEKYDNNDIKKQVYEINNDKKLLKEIIVNEL